MEKLFKKLQNLFSTDIYTIMDYNGDYAINLDDDSETIYIVDGDLFEIIKKIPAYDAEGAYILNKCNIIYDRDLNV